MGETRSLSLVGPVQVGLFLEQEQELSPLRALGLVGWVTGLPRGHRRPAAQHGISGASDSFRHLLGPAIPEAPGSSALPSGRERVVLPFYSCTEASPRSRSVPKLSPEPESPWDSGEIATLPLLVLGTGEIVFICCKKLGLWLGLIKVGNNPFFTSVQTVQVSVPMATVVLPHSSGSPQPKGNCDFPSWVGAEGPGRARERVGLQEPLPPAPQL